MYPLNQIVFGLLIISAILTLMMVPLVFFSGLVFGAILLVFVWIDEVKEFITTQKQSLRSFFISFNPFKK